MRKKQHIFPENKGLQEKVPGNNHCYFASVYHMLYRCDHIFYQYMGGPAAAGGPGRFFRD